MPKKPAWPKSITAGSVTLKVYEVSHPTNASGKAYMLAYSTPRGRKTIKFANPDKALKEAKLKAEQLAAGKIEAAELSAGDREELHAARKLAGSTPLLAALREWAKAHQLTNGELMRAAESWRNRHKAKIENITVNHAIDRYTKAKTALGKENARTSRSHLNALREAFGDQNIADITAQALNEYLGRYAHPVSRNTHRKKIVALWRWSRNENLLPQDARTEAERLERAKEPDNKKGIISPETFRGLLSLVKEKIPEDLPALVVACFAGLRTDEVHSQKWSDIDLEDAHVNVTGAKEGTPARRLVPLCKPAVAWLLTCPNRSGFLCDGKSIERIRKAGIEAGFNLPFNCFRHTYISAAVASTGNLPQVALDSGNSPKEIHKHYRALMKTRVADEWFSIMPSSETNVVSFGT